MNRLVRLFGASVGRKLIVATTGVMLLGFLFGHMYGNMKVFQGPAALNAYAAWLQGHPLLWLFRAGLLFLFGFHVYATLSLARENRAARPVGYRRYRPQASSFTSRYMVLSGLVVLGFLLYHLAHFTFGAVDARNFHVLDAQGRADIYTSVVRSFQNPWIAGSYVVWMLLLGTHLWHGVASAFQTVGVHHESYETLIKVVSLALVAALVLGNCSIPILIYVGKVGT
ncbi:MAG TPA: succinate dehydrogenase cytochrome b subunit [Gemmatimonadales bacterium]|jgi:succinate dehydrogenase / fumarate reductase cytochrome b subunit|nr:succinate dehydrogenase cytochrome b subunit [Gemmatimonadales bacterium]